MRGVWLEEGVNYKVVVNSEGGDSGENDEKRKRRQDDKEGQEIWSDAPRTLARLRAAGARRRDVWRRCYDAARIGAEIVANKNRTFVLCLSSGSACAMNQAPLELWPVVDAGGFNAWLKAPRRLLLCLVFDSR